MPPAPGLLKISELARRTGVPPATIRFYIREGLLPRPTVKTSRNMAYYEESFVGHIQLVRRLQQDRRLPLRVIKSLVVSGGGGEAEVAPSPAELEAGILAALESRRGGPALTREALLARSGIDPDELEALAEIGLVSPTRQGRGQRYSSEDASLVELIARARTLGMGRELFPTADLVIYRDAVSRLVGEETALLVRRLRGRGLPVPPQALVEVALHVMGQFIVELRRKLVGELLAGLEGGRSPVGPEDRPARGPGRGTRSRGTGDRPAARSRTPRKKAKP
ncbi:MAG: MerR family transcriptional regulator [Deltaproteobacteria bacterium]|nr:MerR family transcriptional regulator [Deltaproteobacteria bacterium]